MHLFHRWVTVDYQTHGPIGATVTTRKDRCSVCGRQRLRIVKGMKPQGRQKKGGAW